MKNRLPVAVLAGTGSVGQRFIQLLENHPWFEVIAVTGSERSVGRIYGEICHWILPETMSESVQSLEVLPSTPESFDVPIVFSALPTQVAWKIEAKFAQAGVAVFSNASAYRRESDVPILFPEVNPDHTDLIPVQRERRGWDGFIVTNSNCTSAGMTVVLKALWDSFGVQRVFATSMQAISGAGYPGVPSLDILGNVIPYIAGEEEKVEWEPRKILGDLKGNKIKLADFTISAHANRVPVANGHMVVMSVELENSAEIEQVSQVLKAYQAPEVSRRLPSAPEPVIILHSDPDRPQPRLDINTGKGMATVVGRLRTDPIVDLRMVVFSHNTIRGAAGGSIYNAELLVHQGYVS